jgi:P22 coat protein - gene protein 5
MSNDLALYDPLFYAQEALIQLEKGLGMAARVHRGYDKDPQQKGSTIKISTPGTFSAQDAPSTAQDLTPGSTEIVLSYWREVKFALTDKELTFTTEKIITDHIRPAAYALADDVDTKLCQLYKGTGNYYTVAGTPTIADVISARKALNDLNVPADNRHFMLGSQLEADLLGLAAFSQHQGAGLEGVGTQMRGSLGTKFGFEMFGNNNVQTHVPGVAADATGALSGNHAAGISTVTFNGVTAAATFTAGDHFVIAGNSQRYAFTATATADGAGLVTAAAITPPLVQAYVTTTVITIINTAKIEQLAFHKNAIALAMAPLSEMGNGLGARIATVADPITNLALRSRLFYDGNNSKVYVALDVLYGIKVLNSNLMVRARS